MKLSDDLPPVWIYLKGILFFVLLAASSALVIFLEERPARLFALACVIWSSARLYYFFFYVIEKYLDPSFKFSGLGSVLRYFKGKSRSKK